MSEFAEKFERVIDGLILEAEKYGVPATVGYSVQLGEGVNLTNIMSTEDTPIKKEYSNASIMLSCVLDKLDDDYLEEDEPNENDLIL